MTQGNNTPAKFQRYEAVNAPVVPGLAGRLSYRFSHKKNPLEGIAQIAARSGDIFFLHLFGDDFMVVNAPEGVMEVIETNRVNFTRHASLDPLTAVFGPGFYEPPGEAWENLLKIIAPAFLPEALPAFDPYITEELENLKAEWFEDRDSRDKINIEIEMKKLLLRIVSRTLITPELEINTHPFIEAAEDIFQATNLYTSPKLFPKSKRILHRYSNPEQFPGYVRSSIRYLHGLAEQIGSEYMNIKSVRGKVLELLYQPYVNREITFSQVVDAIKYTLITAALPAAQAMTYLLTAIDTQTGLRRKIEIESSAGSNGNPLLRSALLEACRLSPPVWAIHRVAAREEMVRKYLAPQNTRILISPYILQRDPAHWERPLEFDAERFLNIDTKRKTPVYMPFGFETQYDPTDAATYLCTKIGSALTRDLRVYFYKTADRTLVSTAVTSTAQTLFTKVEAV